MVQGLLIVATLLQLVAVIYGLYLLTRRRGAVGAWLFLLGAMASMLAWRLFVVSGYEPPAFFNPLIAIWGSTCMVAAMALFGREVSARRQAEQQRDALLESERAARMQAERASSAKDEFLATLSHELRSPLAAILGWCAVLQRSRPDVAEGARGLGIIERNARAQARLVDDLLDMTRMRAGTLHLSIATLPLDQPVRAAIQAARPAADAKRLALTFDCPDPPPCVRGDADRLQQVATNLISNALRHTPENGRIAVSVRDTGALAELVVQDTGSGISPEFLPQVFARFSQADSSTTRRHGGLGLGLSIVDHLVRMHGGTVVAESPGLGAGATFTVRLPLAASDAAAAGSGPADAYTTAIDGEAVPLGGLRVLVVDDEEDVRAAVARVLEQHGATVRALADGTQVAEAILEMRPHVLVFDVGMPGEDGYSLIHRVRSLPLGQGAEVPAISLTAHARNEDRARALAAGFNEHLPKPIDVPRLVAIVGMLARTAA